MSEAQLLLSSLAIAATNTGCMVPVFTQVQEAAQSLYLGHAGSHSTCTRFSAVSYSATPAAYAHLSGLLQLFKGKLPCA